MNRVSPVTAGPQFHRVQANARPTAPALAHMAYECGSNEPRQDKLDAKTAVVSSPLGAIRATACVRRTLLTNRGRTIPAARFGARHEGGRRGGRKDDGSTR